MKQIRRGMGLFFLCIFILAGCEDTGKKAQLAKQETLAALASQVCLEAVFDAGQTNAQVACDLYQIQIPWKEQTSPLEIRMVHANTQLTYLKYGASIPAVMSTSLNLQSHDQSSLVIQVQLVAGEKQDQQFDLFYDWNSNIFYRSADGSQGNEVTFLPSLHESLSTELTKQIHQLGQFVIANYGRFYQIQSVLLDKPADQLREDAYDLLFDPALLLHMQYHVSLKDGIYNTKPEEAMGNYDLAKRLLYIHPCEDCEASSAVYDWGHDVVTYYPNTSKEAKLDPNTCTTERYCEASKTIKDRFVASLAIQVRAQPFTSLSGYNQGFTRGDAAEINKYFTAINQ